MSALIEKADQSLYQPTLANPKCKFRQVQLHDSQIIVRFSSEADSRTEWIPRRLTNIHAPEMRKRDRVAWLMIIYLEGTVECRQLDSWCTICMVHFKQQSRIACSFLISQVLVKFADIQAYTKWIKCLDNSLKCAKNSDVFSIRIHRCGCFEQH